MDDFTSHIIGELITDVKYKFADKTLIAEVVRDAVLEFRYQLGTMIIDAAADVELHRHADKATYNRAEGYLNGLDAVVHLIDGDME